MTEEEKKAQLESAAFVKEEPAEVSVETEPEKEVTAEPSDEENKVPYSRFKKFHDEASKAREEAAYWKGIAEASKPVEKEPDTELSVEWKELYGDSDASKRAFADSRKREEAMFEKAQKLALEAIRNERENESKAIEENLSVLDTHLEDVSEVAGRELTDKEQSEILDIIDDYTPKDKEGRYLGAIMTPDKAWEIYELKQNASKAPQRKSRDAVAAISGAASQGEPSGEKAEKDKNFNPLSWPDFSKIK